MREVKPFWASDVIFLHVKFKDWKGKMIKSCYKVGCYDEDVNFCQQPMPLIFTKSRILRVGYLQDFTLKINIFMIMTNFKILLLALILASTLQQNHDHPSTPSHSFSPASNTQRLLIDDFLVGEDAHPTDSEHQTHTDNSQPHTTEEEEQHHPYHTPSDIEFWQNVALASFLTMVGAFCSGMTVGLLSISTMQLQMMTMKKNEEQSRMAKKILSVVSDHHLFLVTLLVANAMALESLPLVVHTLMPDWAAILFSTFIVLIVAEIIPQAYCTGQKKIILAYYASPIILVMIKIFWVIVYPMAKGLDWMLGVHNHERIQHKDFATFLNDDKYLKNTEKLLLTSTLQLRTERVEAIMIPARDFFMLEEKQYITEEVAKQIKSNDYSYVLIYKEKRSKVTGVIKVKEFALRYLKESKRDLRADEIMKPNSNLLTVYADTNLLEMLMLFQAKSTRIALVCNLKKKIDPKIESIMYSKSDMVLSGTGAKDVEVSGIVFLYQIFDTMTKLKTQIERDSQAPSRYMASEVIEQEMTTLRQPLMK